MRRMFSGLVSPDEVLNGLSTMQPDEIANVL